MTTHEPPAAAGPAGLKTEAANEAARTLRRRIRPLDKHTLPDAASGKKTQPDLSKTPSGAGFTDDSHHGVTHYRRITKI